MAIIEGDSGNNILFGDIDILDINDIIKGFAGDDFLYGILGDDTLKGGKHNDYLYGDAGNDILYGQKGFDNLSGGDGDDILKGGKDNDDLNGDKGNDELYGQQGNDTLTGVYAMSTDPGLNEIDILYGGAGNDLFVLGDEYNVYYNDNFDSDYAIIQDFELASIDKIQLHGSSSDYAIISWGGGAAIFMSDSNERIALVEGMDDLLDLGNPDQFLFV